MNELVNKFNYVYGVGSRNYTYKDTLIALWPLVEEDDHVFKDLWKVILDIELPC